MWSWILAFCGISGTFLIGRKNIWGWVVLFFNETLWLVYATQTKQYGFYVGNLQEANNNYGFYSNISQ